LGAELAVPIYGQTSAHDLLDLGVDDWIVVRDREAGGDSPRLNLHEGGLDVLTGASSILFPPRTTVSGDYRVELEVLQFDPGGRNEGFGLLVGGVDLTTPERAYLYFLIRQDGRHLLKRRQADRTFVIRDWEIHSGVRRWQDRGPESAHIRQHIALEVESDGIRIWVNGEEVRTLRGQELETNGAVGLRVNHGLSIRIERFEVTPLTAQPASAALEPI